MRKPSWSCLGALLVALMFQASVEVHDCSPDNLCKDSTTAESLLECIKSCFMDSSNLHRGIAQNELKHTINYSHKKYKQRDIHSSSISSDDGNILDLLSPGVQGESKEVQGESLPLIRKARQLDNKRSYSMEHFRWGKPVGKKRRPVKVYPNGVEEESAESHPTDFRRDLPMKMDYPEGSELIVDRGEDTMEDTMEDTDKKKKKRPVKVYPNGMEEDSAESHLPMNMDYPDVSEIIVDRGEDTVEDTDKNTEKKRERYKMEHFRWGKPVGKKRYTVKVYPKGVKEESAESHPMNFRRDFSMNIDYPEVSELIVNRGEDTMEDTDKNKKNKRGYKIEHFWWGAPPRNKRYGGFMVSEKSHTPLMTLFRNAIIKNAPDKGQ